MSFDLIRADGGYLRDPRRMPRFYGADGVFYRSYNATAVASSATTFWTADPGSIDRVSGSVFVTGAWTADVFRTVASISSGSGAVSHIIGPAAVNNNTTTYRVTVDGIVYTFTIPAVTSGDRTLAGWGVPLAAYTAATTYGLRSGATSSDGFSQQIDSTGGLILPNPNDARVNPGNLLLFKSSLLVEIAHASNIASAAPGSYAGVLMQRFS